MTVLAIDPGTFSSAWCVLQNDLHLSAFGIVENARMRDVLQEWRHVHHVAIEMVACYGMPIGSETFDTCLWIGRFIECWNGPHTLVYRKKGTKECEGVASHLCRSHKAKDANIRQAILDKYPATGGGKTPQIGTKKQPGPLYGVSSHVWSAIAVGITWIETNTVEA